MTAQEIHDKIELIECPYNPESDSRIIKGQLVLERYQHVTRVAMRHSVNPNEMMRWVRKEIYLGILNELYDDQRQKLYKAVMDLRMNSTPFGNPKDFDDAFNAILSAATFQQPESKPCQ